MVVKLTLSPYTLEVVSWWEVCFLPSEALAVEASAVLVSRTAEKTQQEADNPLWAPFTRVMPSPAAAPLAPGVGAVEPELRRSSELCCLPRSVRAFLSGCGEDWGLLAKGLHLLFALYPHTCEIGFH